MSKTVTKFEKKKTCVCIYISAFILPPCLLKVPYSKLTLSILISRSSVAIYFVIGLDRIEQFYFYLQKKTNNHEKLIQYPRDPKVLQFLLTMRNNNHDRNVWKLSCSKRYNAGRGPLVEMLFLWIRASFHYFPLRC